MIINKVSAINGNEYLAKCSLTTLKSLSKAEYKTEITYCTTFVRGIIDSHYATTSYYKTDKMFCIPSGESYMTLTGEIISQLEQKDKYLNESFAGLVMVYLGRAFPCK